MKRERDDLWRLYRREWVTVHTLDIVESEDGEPVYLAAEAWIEANLKDRVPRKDIKVVLNTDLEGKFWGRIEVFKENLKGEFKLVENAQQFAKIKRYDEYVIVPRNSKSDHDIRNYGVARL